MIQRKKQFCTILALALLIPSVVIGEIDSVSAIGKRINGYQFYRQKVVEVTRSIILDYLKEGHFDSIGYAIAYCDSLNHPDSSWISAIERYSIYFLGIDTAHLYSTDFYCTNFDLYDTTKPLQINSCRTNLFLDGMNNENAGHLGLVLTKMCKERLAYNRQEYPKLCDIWDFWDLIVLKTCFSREARFDSLLSFRKKYPNSPFSKLKVLDHQEMISMQGDQVQKTEIHRGKNGGGGLIGADFSLLPNAYDCLYPNHVSLLLNVDVISNNWLFELGFSGTTLKTQENLINIDTLKQGASVSIFNFSLAFGRTFSMRENHYISPLIGVVLQRNIIDEKELVRFDLPYLIAGKLGINYDFIIHNFGSTFVGPSIRVAGGVLVGDFQKISGDFTYYQLYVNVAVGIFGFSAIDSDQNR
jgi:hypothetical protein